MLRFRPALWMLAAMAVSLSACGDGLTSPDPTPPPASEGLLNNLLGGLLGGSQTGTAHAVERSRPLASDEVVSEVIGRSGGVIRLPRSGLTVRIPYGALRRNTRITVTAPAGDLLGYHFAPHGLEFRRKVHMVQDLSRSEVGWLEGTLNSPFVAYFDGPLSPVVNVLERLRLNVLGLLRLATWSVDHFSGYVIATDGRWDDNDDDDDRYGRRSWDF